MIGRWKIDLKQNTSPNMGDSYRLYSLGVINPLDTPFSGL
jgi:hypothetical protein